MDQDTSRKARFLINAAYAAVGIAIFYVLFRYVLYAVMPFAIAIIVTLVLNKPIVKLKDKLKIRRKSAALAVLLIFYVAIAVLFTLVVVNVFASLFNWFENIPAIYEKNILPLVNSGMDKYSNLISRLNPEQLGYVEQAQTEVLAKLAQIVESVSAALVNVAKSLVVKFPTSLISTIFCVVATAFLTLDFPAVSHFVMAQLDDDKKRIVYESKDYLVNTFSKMMSAYLKIMCITFMELWVGLIVLLHQPDSGLIALIIAVFDILPVLGTGAILWPWMVIKLLSHDYIFAIKLFLMYMVITIVRNTIEPKMVGAKIGLHPVLMLASIFLGAKIFGPLGILIMPFTLIVLKNLNDTGRIHVFKSDYLDKDAFDAEEAKYSWKAKHALKRKSGDKHE